MRMDEKYKEQFKKLSEMLVTIEQATVQRYNMLHQGFPLNELDIYLQQEGLNVSGIKALVAMIKQSDTIMFNTPDIVDATALIPRPPAPVQDDGLVDAFYTEL